MNIYYVYAYIRTNSNIPYYIGKGKGKRAYVKHNNVSTPKNKSKIIILESKLTEIGALAIERRMIRWYGRKEEGGVLLNKSEGGDLPPSHKNKKRSEYHKQAISKSKLGKKRSIEERIAISLGKKGKKIGPASEERKIAIAKARKGKIWFKDPTNNYCICCYPGEKPAGWIRGMVKSRSKL